MKKNLLTILFVLLSLFIFVGCEITTPIDDTPDDTNNQDTDPNSNTNPSTHTDENKDKEKEQNHSGKVEVKLGIDLIDDNLAIFEGKNVGLITNATGVNSNFKSTIDILYEKVNLVALFAPEHGIRGAAAAGQTIGNEIDPVTGLTVYSLYGSTSTPTKEMMNNIDILCIDIQDVGARFYTYIYTMSRAMQACKTYGKQFVVFDRPNPVSGNVFEGNILDMNYSSGIGLYPIIQRHGLTIGEIARLFNKEYGIDCSLYVIEMQNWSRDLYIDETTCPWILPSPNMPTLDTALVYTGTCIFEGTNLSEGRGTTRPFELIGAPWIDSIALANRLNSLNLEGVYFRPAAFTPTTSKHSGKTCYGVQVHVLDRTTFKPVKVGWTMVDIIREMYPDNFGYTSSFNLLSGCSYLKEDSYTLDQLYEILEKDTNTFANTRSKYLLYN